MGCNLETSKTCRANKISNLEELRRFSLSIQLFLKPQPSIKMFLELTKS
jgi:hypothetical protein